MATNNPSISFSEEMETEEITNPETVLPKGRFPGVVCFYRSANQSEQKYGFDSSNPGDEGVGYVPQFGFDTYIPKLYGTDAKVQSSYLKTSDVKIKFDVKDNAGTSTQVDLYPVEDELVHNTLASRSSVTQYYTPWLNPTTGNITLHVKVLFPDSSTIGIEDEFNKYKSEKTETDEIIYFKLVKVKVSGNAWTPVLQYEENATSRVRTPKQNLYEGLDTNIPLTEAEQDEKNAITTEKNRIQTEKSRIDGLIRTRTRVFDKEDISKLERSAIRLSDEGKVTESQEKQKKADALRRKHNMVTTVITVQSAYTESSNFSNQNPNLDPDIEKLEADQIKFAERNYKMTMLERFNMPDPALSISGGSTFNFTFATPETNSATVQITRDLTENNNNAALIAYYKRKDDENIEREYIIGQVNILAYDFCRLLPKNGKIAAFIDVPLYMNPIPMHYIHVELVDHVESTSPEGLRIYVPAPIPAGTPPAPVVSRDRLTSIKNDINNYFKQTGLSVKENRSVSTLSLKLLTKSDNTRWALLNGQEFEVGLFDGVNYLKTVDVSNRSLDTDLMEEFKKYLLEAVFLTVPHTNTPGSSIPCANLDAQLVAFIDRYPDLCPTLEIDGIIHYDSEKLFDLMQRIVSYLTRFCYLTFVIPQIEGGDGVQTTETAGSITTTYTHSSKAYVKMDSNSNGSNYITLFNSGYTAAAEVIAHELGHSLNLQHTFHDNIKMYPDSVDFEMAPNWAHQVATKNDKDAGGYAATYNNIMDYSSIPSVNHGPDPQQLNNRFVRNTFVKKQWDSMMGKIAKESFSLIGDTRTITYGVDYEPNKEMIELLIGLL